MIEKEKIFELADVLISDSAADDTEVFFSDGQRNLTRFANNTIHQNVSVTDAQVLVRVAFGKRLGVASSNSLDDAGRVLEEACGIAKVSEESPAYAGLPGPRPVQEVEAFDEAAAACDAITRAERVGHVVDEARSVGAVAAGALATGVGQVAIVNSKGVHVHHRDTEVHLNVVMMKEGGSGSASQMGWKLCDVDELAVARRVAERTVKTVKPQDIDPGEYVVVLEPEAVAVLTQFLVYVGLNGKAYHEKRSFMSGKMGFAVTGPLITLVDDGLDPAGLPMPFDCEGVPKKRVVLINKGIAAGMVYDTATAAAERTESTGHALPSSSSFGPVPLNLFMDPGDSTLDEMIRKTRKGLLVSRFHYANVVEPMKVVVTGMTRFGLFLIRDGEIAHPVKNLRFTQGVLEAYEAVSALTSDRLLTEGLAGGMLVPGMKCDAFTFTGKTEF